MRHFVSRLISAALFLSVFINIAYSSPKLFIPETMIDNIGYLPLYDIVTETGIDHSYNPVAKRGKLYRKEHQAIYLEDCSVMIIDGALARAKGPVLRKNNEIMIPSSLFETLFKSFFPEKTIAYENHGYSLQQETADAAIEPSGDTAKTVSRKNKGTSSAAEKIGFLILDAGHGGKDPGAINGSTHEKNITLSVVKRIASMVKKKNPSLKIYLTRSNDTFVELSGRTAIANRKLTNEIGGVFVSIHVNASIIPKMTGYETYFLSQNPTNDEARNTAAFENHVIILDRPSKRDDIAQTQALMLTTQIQKESSDLADIIQNTLAGSVKESPSRGVKTADFYVLRGSLMPAVLVEIGYITNEKERKLLITTGYQNKISQSVSEGICKFLNTYNK